MNRIAMASALLSASILGCAVGQLGIDSPAATAAESGDSTREHIRRTLADVNDCPPCVVQIQCKHGDFWGAQGTGVMLKDGRILTAAHVVDEHPDDRHEISVIFGGRNGHKLFDGAQGRRIEVKFNRNADLAVLTGVVIPDFATGKGAALGDRAPQDGDLLTSVGLENLEAIRVHAAPMIGRDSSRPMVYMGVTAQQGDSGGPVFDRKGQLVAINSAIGGFTKVDSEVIELPNGQLFKWSSRYIPCTFVIDLNHEALKGFLK
jgi:S1-C subfamily serine protease